MKLYLPSSVIPDAPTYTEKVGEVKVGPYTLDVVVEGYGDKFYEVKLKLGKAEMFFTSYTRKDLALQKARSIVKHPHRWIRWRGGEK